MLEKTESLPPLDPGWALRMSACRRRSALRTPYIRGLMPFLALDTRRFPRITGAFRSFEMQTGMPWPGPRWTGGRECDKTSGSATKPTEGPADREVAVATTAVNSKSTGCDVPPLGLAFSLWRVLHETGVSKFKQAVAGRMPQASAGSVPPLGLAFSLRRVLHETGVSKLKQTVAGRMPQASAGSVPPLGLAFSLRRVLHETGGSKLNQTVAGRMPQASAGSVPLLGLAFSLRRVLHETGVPKLQQTMIGRMPNVAAFQGIAAMPASALPAVCMGQEWRADQTDKIVRNASVRRSGLDHGIPGATLANGFEVPMPHHFAMGRARSLPPDLPDGDPGIGCALMERRPAMIDGLSFVADKISLTVKQEVALAMKQREEESLHPSITSNREFGLTITENQVSDGFAKTCMRKMQSLAGEERFRMGLLR